MTNKLYLGKIFYLFFILLMVITLPHAQATKPPSEEGRSGVPMDEDWRAIARGHHEVDSGLSAYALYALEKARLEAAGLSDEAILASLWTDRGNRAFPFSSRPELIARGAPRVLTVLIDFKDYRAATAHPGMSVDDIRQNIHGAGTQTAQQFAPLESVREYYLRSSHGRLDLQGDVLGWYSLPKERAEYESASTDQAAENRAIFTMITEALDHYDANHSFQQYDNDNDGDIDLVNIIYAGPNRGGRSFWWAYQWKLFIPEAENKRYDGKRLKQIIFQFLDTRAGNDFNPQTMIHEVGHALGLPDYYDTKVGMGPAGGVGGLDIMGACTIGNHNAFSRWLLGWIDPVVIGSGAPARRQLVASGADDSNDKAIAFFPNAKSTSAPDQELFVVENRHPVGNDDRRVMPGDGLLIWHVDATPNNSNDGFKYNNSTTNRKLIRLIRADSATDFNDWEMAKATTYYDDSREFTPSSLPNSNDYAGNSTNAVVRGISQPAPEMWADIGFIQGGAAQPTPVAADTEWISELYGAWRAPHSYGIDLQQLEELAQQLQMASAKELSDMWRIVTADADSKALNPRQQLLFRLILVQWAAKDGASSVASLLAVEDEGLVSDMFADVMAAWARSDPGEASRWYLADAQSELRCSPKLAAGTAFTSAIYAYTAQQDLEHAIQLVNKLSHVSEVKGAADAIHLVASQNAMDTERVSALLADLEAKAVLNQAIREFSQWYEKQGTDLADPELLRELELNIRKEFRE